MNEAQWDSSVCFRAPRRVPGTRSVETELEVDVSELDPDPAVELSTLDEIPVLEELPDADRHGRPSLPPRSSCRRLPRRVRPERA